ncbi:hypothetical protein B9479_002006 [Cryptococcus floricola]|uniref:HMG box domain-containing protein n=1 Tax=Cryptococcus floricola TaxID=2591691 RepID=A0A5D3B547_9TREE|nr:hypothetical protein B9479_002006 [Cryptococcus floricola]
MSRGGFRERPIIVISDSEDDLDEAFVLPKPKALSRKAGKSTIVPISKPDSKMPLSPRRTVVFAPSPAKPDSVGSKPNVISAAKKPIAKFTKSPAPQKKAIVISDSEDDVDVESLGLDQLKIGDPDMIIGRSFGVDTDDNLASAGDVLSSPTRRPSAKLPSLLTSSLRLNPPPVFGKSASSSVCGSDSEEDWVPTRTPRRTPGKAKRLILSEDEEETEGLPMGRTVAKFKRPNASIFLDLAADVEDEEVEEGEGGYYDEDDSYGSLRDFIVDDSDADDYAEAPPSDESEEEDFQSRSERKKSRQPPQDIEEVGDLSEDGENSGGTRGIRWGDEDTNDLLHYSPPRRPVQVSDLNIKSLTIIDGTDSESDDPLPIHTPNKPKKTVKTKAKPPDTPSSKARADMTKKGWNQEREKIASSLFKELDETVFQKKLGEKGAKATIEWNSRLLKTAGMARQRRPVLKDGNVSTVYLIELSEKVLTDESRIKNTLAHEMCHLATWAISGDLKNPHGKHFKSWANAVMNVRGDIEVTTRHNYVIEYKYEWKCSNATCGAIYKRQSKSIDITKQVCGTCRSKLAPLFETSQKAASGFQLYLKENMKNAKAAMPSASHGDVMRALSARWTGAGKEATSDEHAKYWKDMAANRRFQQ